jgi:hypothetical protein
VLAQRLRSEGYPARVVYGACRTPECLDLYGETGELHAYVISGDIALDPTGEQFLSDYRGDVPMNAAQMFYDLDGIHSLYGSMRNTDIPGWTPPLSEDEVIITEYLQALSCKEAAWSPIFRTFLTVQEDTLRTV